MKFYVKSRDKNKVALMTELGHVLAYYDSVAEALNTCNEWYLYNKSEPRQQVIIQSGELVLSFENTTAG